MMANRQLQLAALAEFSSQLNLMQSTNSNDKPSLKIHTKILLSISNKYSRLLPNASTTFMQTLLCKCQQVPTNKIPAILRTWTEILNSSGTCIELDVFKKIFISTLYELQPIQYFDMLEIRKNLRKGLPVADLSDIDEELHVRPYIRRIISENPQLTLDSPPMAPPPVQMAYQKPQQLPAPVNPTSRTMARRVEFPVERPMNQDKRLNRPNQTMARRVKFPEERPTNQKELSIAQRVRKRQRISIVPQPPLPIPLFNSSKQELNSANSGIFQSKSARKRAAKKQRLELCKWIPTSQTTNFQNPQPITTNTSTTARPPAPVIVNKPKNFQQQTDTSIFKVFHQPVNTIASKFIQRPNKIVSLKANQEKKTHGQDFPEFSFDFIPVPKVPIVRPSVPETGHTRPFRNGPSFSPEPESDCYTDDEDVPTKKNSSPPVINVPIIDHSSFLNSCREDLIRIRTESLQKTIPKPVSLQQTVDAEHINEGPEHFINFPTARPRLEHTVKVKVTSKAPIVDPTSNQLKPRHSLPHQDKIAVANSSKKFQPSSSSGSGNSWTASILPTNMKEKFQQNSSTKINKDAANTTKSTISKLQAIKQKLSKNEAITTLSSSRRNNTSTAESRLLKPDFTTEEYTDLMYSPFLKSCNIVKIFDKLLVKFTHYSTNSSIPNPNQSNRKKPSNESFEEFDRRLQSLLSKLPDSSDNNSFINNIIISETKKDKNQ